MSLHSTTVSTPDYLSLVESLYDGILNRNGDDGGIDYWVGQLQSGAVTVHALAASFLASQEAHDLYAGKSPADTIEAFYQQILGRASDADGKAYWMSSGLSLADIALGIIGSQESHEHNGGALLAFQAAAVDGADFDGTGTLDDFVAAPTVKVDIVKALLSDGQNSSQVTFQFSEKVKGFDVNDVTAEHGTLSYFTNVDGSHYTATFTADDGFTGTGKVTVGTDYTDLAGNAGSGGSHDVAIDTANPTVEVDIVAAALNYEHNSSQVTFQFSEKVKGFDVNDVTAEHGTLSYFTNVDGSHYTATFTADDGFTGTGKVTVGTDYTDLAGNAGDGAGSGGSYDVAIDTAHPHHVTFSDEFGGVPSGTLKADGTFDSGSGNPNTGFYSVVDHDASTVLSIRSHERQSAGSDTAISIKETAPGHVVYEFNVDSGSQNSDGGVNPNRGDASLDFQVSKFLLSDSDYQVHFEFKSFLGTDHEKTISGNLVASDDHSFKLVSAGTSGLNDGTVLIGDFNPSSDHVSNSTNLGFGVFAGKADVPAGDYSFEISLIDMTGADAGHEVASITAILHAHAEPVQLVGLIEQPLA